MQNQDRSTLLYGAIAAAIGVVSALGSLGVFGPTRAVSGEERAVGFCICAVFAAGGVAAMLTTLRGPLAATAIKLLGFAIVTGFAAIAGWISIGPGDRHFGGTLAMFGPHANEIGGRVFFGVGALICLAMAMGAARGFLRRAEPSRTGQDPRTGGSGVA